MNLNIEVIKMGLAQPLPTLSVEEYLDMERTSEIRHEFLDGFVYMMAGESPEHSNICFNLGGIVYSQLSGKNCRGFSPNMKVRTDAADAFAYPDLTIVCGEPVYHDARRDVLMNPTVIFEVLSPSTEKYDRGEKFSRYKQIAALTDYILVAQNAPRIEHHTKQANGDWNVTIIEGLANSFFINPINCRLELADVYERVLKI